ncbi:MAG: ABC transporter ATP-binding protein [Parcubacteria group bacterium]|nr:ABC transporter ATP-binding protein [Parcubacteria group bacterium]
MLKYSSWQLIKNILDLLKPYRLRFWLASLIRLLGDLAWLYPAFAFASIITFLTHYKPGDSLNYLWLILGLWLAAGLVRSFSQFFSKYLGYRVAEKLAMDSNLKTVRHLFRLDMAWHERENSGNKIKRIQNAGDGFNKILRLWFNSIIEVSVNLIAINIIISRFDQTVLIVLIIFLITYFFISAAMTRRAGAASYRVNAQEENVNGLLLEAINNIRTVKVMSMAKILLAALIKGTDNLLEKLKIRIFWYQSRNAFLSFWTIAFRLGLTFIIIRGILAGRYEIGFLILFSSYFSELRMSIDELSTASIDLATSKISIARMQNILNEPIIIDDEKGKLALPPDWRKITVKNLAFSYGENKVLEDISFTVRRGEKVGIVGLSGAGKSTLFKLLLKEREEFSGDILFDSLSIKQIRKNDYFKQTSVVLQETEVFSFSLKDNITITNDQEKSNQKLLKQALATAHIADLADKLPRGLDTLIGEKGIKLSGGEKQRLGIARAIFKQPQILLLDEATSHLDLESEEKIRDSLHKFFKNVTAIIIAHRLTTIKEMNKILVIENGRIVEAGNFAELHSSRGKFYELWEKQKL